MFLCRKKRKPTPSGVVYRTYGIISLPLTGIPVAVAKNEIVHIPGIVFIQLHLPCLLSCFVVCIIAPPSRMCKAFAVRLDVYKRQELSRKNGWADEYGRIYLYYPICEVVDLLRCGRQKAVNTLRELQYAGLVEIQKQGCGKPNRIYPKSYEAVSNTDFKKSGYGTPED